MLVMLAVAAHADKLPEPTPASMPPAKTKVKRQSSEDAKLRELTNDPLLGKADRISGEEVKGLVTFTFDD
ncbi:MAG: hypothetical protein H0T65_26240, partial [Deltaproteobacteria bacterium]|nr:hypothetical protein [Deltaproteobacteria bacterium]